MNYQRWHDAIIERARRRKTPHFVEWHHVCPRALGGSDAPDNLVALTYREHFLVHWLLTRILTGRDRSLMVYALHCMTMAVHGRSIAAWRYEVAKRTLRRDYLRRARDVIEGRKLAWREYIQEVKQGAADAESQVRGLDPARSTDRARMRELTTQFLRGDQHRLDRKVGKRKRSNHRRNRILSEAREALD